MKAKKMKNLCTALTLAMIVNTISVTAFATDICETDTQEPMRYLTVDTEMVVATPIESGWKTTILATDVDSSWNETDDINVVNFDNALISKNADSSITMEFNDVDYENGMLVVLLFYNENKREYAALQIDFSDTGIPTFQSEVQRNRVMQNCRLRSESIILDGEKPDDIHDAKQEFNKMVEPPSDIVLAESQGAEYNAQTYSSAGNWTSTTTESTQFYVYNSSGAKYMTTHDPFYAIQYISVNRLANWSVKQSNDNREVFKYDPNNHSTFYLFQFGNFYGSTTKESEVKNWTSYADYAHVVRADGIYGSNTSSDRSSSQPYSH